MPKPSSPLHRTVIAAFALGSAAAFAARPPTKTSDHNRYKWRDAQGNLHFGDSVPADAVRLGYDIVSPQGIVIKHVERAKTAEEIAAAKAQAAKLAAAQKLEADRLREDERLLSTYPQEADLRRAQQQQLDMLEQQIRSSEVSLRNQEQSLAELLDRAAEAERTGKELPADQARRLTAMRKQVDMQRMAVSRSEKERDDARVRFEGEVGHYLELRAAKDALGKSN
jgi:hypothetical protein